MCVGVCAFVLPIFIPVQLKYLAGSIWRLHSIKDIQAVLQGDYRGVVLWGRRTDKHSTGTLKEHTNVCKKYVTTPRRWLA